MPPVFQLPGIASSQVLTAHAAATNVILEEDWLQPGIVDNPLTGKLFQPIELFGTRENRGGLGLPGILYNNWYMVNFGGNQFSFSYAPGQPDNSGYTTSSSTINSGFSAILGWWGPIPILPFATPFTRTSGNPCP